HGCARRAWLQKRQRTSVRRIRRVERLTSRSNACAQPRHVLNVKRAVRKRRPTTSSRQEPNLLNNQERSGARIVSSWRSEGSYITFGYLLMLLLWRAAQPHATAEKKSRRLSRPRTPPNGKYA